MMMRFALNLTNTINYSARTLKQQSVDRHVASLGHIILMQSQPVFAPYAYCCVLNGEVTNIIFTVFGLTRSWLEGTIHCTRGKQDSHYTTNTVLCSFSNTDKHMIMISKVYHNSSDTKFRYTNELLYNQMFVGCFVFTEQYIYLFRLWGPSWP